MMELRRLLRLLARHRVQFIIVGGVAASLHGSARSTQDLDVVYARDAQNLAVEIRVMFNPDGSVARAEIVDTSRMASDAFYRTAAESAYRAVLLCSPLQQMPVKKRRAQKRDRDCARPEGDKDTKGLYCD